MSNTIVSSRPLPAQGQAPGLSSLTALQRSGGNTDYRPSRVDTALREIRADFADGTVWNNELQQNARRIAELTPRERQSLVNLMANDNPGPQSLLMRWMREVTSTGIGPYAGLDNTQIARVWGQLVAGQDPANLERLFHAATSHNFADHGDQPFQQMFASAVAVHGSAGQRLAFISRMADNAAQGNRSAARAIGVVMASLRDPALMAEALGRLDRQTMDAVVPELVTVKSRIGTNTFGGTTVHEKVDASLYLQLAQGVAASPNAREKAGFIAASGQLLGKMNKSSIGIEARLQARALVAQGMSTVIGSDVNGVIDNTLLQNASEGRSSGRVALKAYADALLDSGKGSHLGAIVLSLQRGNHLDQDPMRNLGQSQSRNGEAPSYQRARVLGAWLGVVGSAVQSRISQRDQNAAYASLIFTGSVDTLKEVTGAAFPGLKLPLGLAVAALKPAVNASLLRWRTELSRSDRSFAQSLYEAALPHHANGVEATAPWVGTLNESYLSSLQRQ